MHATELVGEIDVCADCMLADANGEIDPDRPADEPEVWSEIGFGYRALMGGTHADDCPNGPDGTRDVDCDCDRTELSTSQCDGCGSYSHGSRHTYTLFRVPTAVAHFRARQAIADAREWRTFGATLSACEAIAVAAQWREYLAVIAASDRRFRISMARMRAERTAA